MSRGPATSFAYGSVPLVPFVPLAFAFANRRHCATIQPEHVADFQRVPYLPAPGKEVVADAPNRDFAGAGAAAGLQRGLAPGATALSIILTCNQDKAGSDSRTGRTHSDAFCAHQISACFSNPPL